MVGFTIVNLREVHQHKRSSAHTSLRIIDVLPNIADLEEEKKCGALLRTDKKSS